MSYLFNFRSIPSKKPTPKIQVKVFHCKPLHSSLLFIEQRFVNFFFHFRSMFLYQKFKNGKDFVSARIIDKFDVTLNDERVTWQDHTVRKDQLSPSRLERVVNDVTVLLCFRQVEAKWGRHKHYFLMFEPSGMIAQFKPIIAGKEFSIFHITPSTKENVGNYECEKEFDFTAEMRARLEQVEFFNNYSIMLRNCEHIARYVVEGNWHSTQVLEKGENNQFQRFLKYAAKEASRELYTPPNGLVTVEIAPQVTTIAHAKWNFEHTPQETSTTDGYNVLFLGPSGGGKSNMINHIFGQSLAKSARHATSEFELAHFYHGRCSFPSENGTEQRKVCLIDSNCFMDEVAIKKLAAEFRAKNVPIHRFVVVFGERIRDLEMALWKKCQKQFNFETNWQLFSLVLTKCEDMDFGEREIYMSNFTSIAAFNNFKEPIYSMESGDKRIRIDRTVCVALKDLKKIKDYSPFESDRETLLSCICNFNSNDCIEFGSE